MRAAAILGLGCSSKGLIPFQTDSNTEWRIGMPDSSDQDDIILIFGGDGTIHRHLEEFVKFGLPVLVVPVGSGNDFARAIGLRNVRDSVTAWRKFCSREGNVREIDLGVIAPLYNGKTLETTDETLQSARYFCCVAGVGLDAEVTRRANLLPRWLRGHGGYALSLVPTVFTFAPFPMKILIPDRDSKDCTKTSTWAPRVDQLTILAAFANAPVYGGGMKIAPRAKMDDGLLDVCVIGGIDPFKLFCMFPTVYSGRHLSIREINYFSAGRARVETEHPFDVYADGEFVCRMPVEISVRSKALKVVMP